MFNISKSLIKIACPDCGFIKSVKLLQVQKEEIIICSGCTKEIKLIDHDKSVQRTIKSVNSSMEDLNKTLKNLFK